MGTPSAAPAAGNPAPASGSATAVSTVSGATASVAAAAGTIRRRSRTPPGFLRLLSAGLVGVLMVTLSVCLLSTLSRQHAVDALARDSGASFVAAQQLHAELSVADATVARAFLAGGVEPPAQRTAYQESIASASGRIVDLALAGGPREPLSVLAAQLPVYTGLIERARANNRIGNVVGGAYLRQASELMQTRILPAVDRLAAEDALDIDRGYAQATRWYQPVLVGVAGAAALVALVALQIRLFRRTHRMFNLRLVAATVLVVIATGLTLLAFGVSRARLVDSRNDAFRPMTVVAQVRVLALRAWGDESLSLIARGNGDDLDADARRVTERLGYDPAGRPAGTGTLATAAALDGPDAPGRDVLVPDWERYQDTAVRVRDLVRDVGGFQEAVRVALDEGTSTFTRFDGDAETAFTASRGRFAAGLSSAAGTYDGVAAGTGTALGLAMLLTLAGVQSRINDYR
ncbi:putative secreted protein [Parafrankia sp. Ea1.12]|nr:putative secreted protein [Parafrankia sp. Ea1.12]